MEKPWDHLLMFGIYKQVLTPPSIFCTDAKAQTVLKNLPLLFKSSKKWLKPFVKKLQDDDDLNTAVKSSTFPMLLYNS
ncbi:hypothetical protein AOXY_G3668 [Acipenser oxyrinchus oxyrinchus]|uniref:Uncharacterized protein n=1 Tax=Acipenser oxyrinchus oxyrinchus TaxID=40147 RepID=A0AAD8LSA0_ACIOX|nr:hypothetical protein AOXY_G3668 [Acipenser oxyrinchus oxyrinchus]